MLTSFFSVRPVRREESGDSARAILLGETDQLDYYVQPSDELSRPQDSEPRDRVGRLPKGFFDDV